MPGALGAKRQFRRDHGRALEDGKIDGFWANGMGRVAVRRGVGTVVLDVRRGGGPQAASTTPWPRLPPRTGSSSAPQRRQRRPIRAIVKTQAALRQNVARAAEVGRKLFPPSEAELIAELIRRDLPYYNPTISEAFVAGMNQFARDIGILEGRPL